MLAWLAVATILSAIYCGGSSSSGSARRRLGGTESHDPSVIFRNRRQYINHVQNLSSYYATFLSARLAEQRLRTCAAVTVVHNEKLLLPIWLEYLSRHVDPRDVYVLDDHSTDGSLDNLQRVANVIPIPSRNRSGTNHEYDVWFVESQGSQFFALSALSAGYRCVIALDVDEVLLVDPYLYPGGLKDLISDFLMDDNRPYVKAVGRDLLHVSIAYRSSHIEAGIDLNKPILQQRAYWINNTMYDKIVITKVPVRYIKGKHRAYLCDTGGKAVAKSAVFIPGYPASPTVLAPYNNETLIDEIPTANSPVLLHLHSMDKNYCTDRERHKFDKLNYFFEGQRSRDDSWNNIFLAKKKVISHTVDLL